MRQPVSTIGLAAAACCACLTVQTAHAQRAPARIPGTVRTPAGVDLVPGIGLTRGATIYADGVRSARVLDRSVLRLAWSPLDGAALRLVTPEFHLSEAASVHVDAAMGSVRRFATLDGQPATLGPAVSLYGRQFSVRPMLSLQTPLEAVRLSAGPVFEYTTLGSSLAAAAGRMGAQARLEGTWASAEAASAFTASVGGVWYAPVWGLTRSVTVGNAEARARVTLPVPFEPALLVRGGLLRTWGPTDLYTAAYLGGDATFRGAATARYAGTMASYAGAELRVPVSHVEFLGDASVGVLGFVDAGRTWTEAGYGTGWLTAVGGGLWIRPGSSSRTFSAGVGRGPEGPRVYFRTDIGF